jgi:CRP/FNR family cyclic AMP-dependent transcriptional regulator
MTNPSAAFANLDEAHLRELAPHGAVRSVPKNTIVVYEGEESDSLYVLLSGRVKIFISAEDGKEIVLNTMSKGEYFGELVLDGGPRTASVMTLEPCKLFVIPQRDVEGLLLANAGFSRDMLERVIAKVRSLTAKVRDLALRDVYGRFVRFTEDNAVEMNGERVIPEKLTQAEIAARIGGSREMVSRIVRDLTQGGYIAIEAKRIRLLKKLPANW